MSLRPRFGIRFAAALGAALLASPAALAAEESPGGEVVGAEAVRADSEIAADTDDDAVMAAGDVEVVDQGGQRVIDEITVTANRREESIQDAAVSVTALSGRFLEETGLTDFAEVQKFTPNLVINQSTDTRSTSIRIRGIGSTGSNAGISPSVGVFIDGVYQGRAGMSVQDLLDIDRVEVLRGPQGTLYGKNTAAGAITVTSKPPNYELSSQWEGVFGNYDDVEGRFALNLPIVDDKLATRFAGYGVKRDGFDKNLAPEHYGSRVNDAQKFGFRSRTLWDVTDDFSLMLSADYSNQDDKNFVPDIIEYGSDDNPLLISAAESADRLGITLPDENPLSPRIEGDPFDRIVRADVSPINQVDVYGVSLEGDWTLGNHQLVSLTAYRGYDNHSRFDGDFSEIPALQWDTQVALDQWSTELRLVSPGAQLIDYVSGFYFYWSEMQTDDTLEYLRDFVICCLIFEDDPVDPQFPDFQFNTGDNNHQTTNVAGYTEVNINVSDLWDAEYIRWVLTGGVRVNWEQIDWDMSQRSDGKLATIPSPVSGVDIDCKLERSVTDVSGRAISELHLGDDIMLYASFANGFKSGGFNQLRENQTCKDAEFDDEESFTYEAGLRTTWFDRMLTFNFTGYFTDYEDFQAQIFDGFNIEVDNAAAMEVYGFEAEITIVPMAQWVTVFGAGYNVTEYTDYEQGPCRGQDARDMILVPGGCQQDLTGKRVDNAPKWNLSLFSQWEDELPVTWFDTLYYAQITYNYQGMRYLTTALDPILKQENSNVLGWRVGLRAPDETWDVSFWMNNVTDEDWAVIGFDVPTLGGYANINAPPRTYGGTIRLKF